jgi:hypothetical protein
MVLELTRQELNLNNMKKLIVIFVLVALATVGYSQRTINRTVTASNYADTYTTDIALLGNDTILNYAINFQTPDKYYYDGVVELKSVAVTKGASVQLQGKLWDSDAYANIGSAVVWAGTTADTTIAFTQHTTLQKLQYLKYVIDGDSATVDFIKTRIWK